jgi:hypothetical protein
MTNKELARKLLELDTDADRRRVLEIIEDAGYPYPWFQYFPPEPVTYPYPAPWRTWTTTSTGGAVGIGCTGDTVYTPAAEKTFFTIT